MKCEKQKHSSFPDFEKLWPVLGRARALEGAGLLCPLSSALPAPGLRRAVPGDTAQLGHPGKASNP